MMASLEEWMKRRDREGRPMDAVVRSHTEMLEGLREGQVKHGKILDEQMGILRGHSKILGEHTVLLISLDARSKRLEDGQKELRIGQKRLDERVGKLGERVGKLDEKVGKLDEKVGKLGERVGNLEAGQQRLEGGQQKLLEMLTVLVERR
jgi:chromosome segregation ATPase